jgi:FkbM family methyltransferase
MAELSSRAEPDDSTASAPRPPFRRVEAIHPNWSGFLRLSTIDSSVEQEGYINRGTFSLAGDTLTIDWGRDSIETFSEIAGMFVHHDLLGDVRRVGRLFAVVIGEAPLAVTRVSVRIPGAEHEVSLRLRTSDIMTFDQVFVARDYDSPNLPASADVIVDLGANIGLATMFLGLRYPTARILAVEPEPRNFAALRDNIRALGDRARARHAAAWSDDGVIHLHTEAESGLPFDAWGVRVSARPTSTSGVTEARRMTTLLDEAGFDRVDILKIDIEGAELELFSEGAEAWLPRINMVIIETHERFRPGSDAAARRALAPLFEELPASAGNLFFRRRPAR